MQSIDVYKVVVWKEKFLLVMTIIDGIISGPEVVQKSVSGHFLKQYYLRCHHAKETSLRKTWTTFLHIRCTLKFVSALMVSYFLSNLYFFTNWWPFSNYENFFLFNRKSYFRSQFIQFLVIFSLPLHTSKFKWKWNNLWCHELTCINLQM